MVPIAKWPQQLQEVSLVVRAGRAVHLPSARTARPLRGHHVVVQAERTVRYSVVSKTSFLMLRRDLAARASSDIRDWDIHGTATRSQLVWTSGENSCSAAEARLACLIRGESVQVPAVADVRFWLN